MQLPPEIQPGLTGEYRTVVDVANAGPPPRQVFATASVLTAMELAATEAVDRYLPAGWMTVGVAANFRHLTSAFLGEEVVATAELAEVDGRKLVFRAAVHAGGRKIGEGTHERRAVDMAWFQNRGPSES